MNIDQKPEGQADVVVSLTARTLLLLGFILLLATFIVRMVFKEYDGGLANVLTLILGFSTWLFLTLGLMASPCPPAYWRSAVAVPLILLVLGLSMFRFVRFDGELMPQFEPRWTKKASLPDSSVATSLVQGDSMPVLIPAEMLAPRATDFPQFLGQKRSGILESAALDTNWKAKPPEFLWKQPIGAGWSGFAVQGDVAVTMEQREQEQWVSAYNVTNGTIYWHVALPGSHYNAMGGAGPRATPTIDGDFVFVQSATGQVACIELSTSRIVWQHDLLKIGGWDQAASEAAIAWGRSGSPLVTANLVVVPLGAPDGTADRSLIAFDKKSGEVRWRAGNDQISYASPSITSLLGQDQIVITNEATVTGHEVDSGKVIWTEKWEGHSNSSANCSQTVTISPTLLFISKGYTQGSKLIQFSVEGQEWKTKTIWQESTVMKTKFTSPLVRGDYAYGLSDGRIECIQVKDGKRQWKDRSYGHGQMLLIGDNLLVMAEQGELALVAADPKRFTELSRMRAIQGVTWNIPTLSGDRLLIRNSDEAACLRLPVK